METSTETVISLKDYIYPFVEQSVDGDEGLCFNSSQMDIAAVETVNELLTDRCFVNMLRKGEVNLADSKVMDTISNAVGVGIGCAEEAM